MPSYRLHDCEPSQGGDLLAQRAADAEIGEVALVETGERGHRHNAWRRRRGPCGFDRGADHGSAAGGVDGGQVDTERGNPFHRARHGARNVVELEIKEDPLPARGDHPHHGGTVDAEKLQADLVEPDRVAEAVNNSLGLGGGGDIEGDDQFCHRLLQSCSSSMERVEAHAWRRMRSRSPEKT